MTLKRSDKCMYSLLPPKANILMQTEATAVSIFQILQKNALIEKSNNFNPQNKYKVLSGDIERIQTYFLAMEETITWILK